MLTKRLWSIGGGKGGVGKSIITLGLGISLARMGKKVILIDCDLGGANLHTLMGMRYPSITLEHFLARKVSRLEETVIETPIEGMTLISGADDVLGAANPAYAQKIRFLKELEELPAQYILLDLGAGSSLNILDFFNYSPGKIIVCTPQATSLQNAYGFIKSALYRKLSREFAKEAEVFELLFPDGQDAEDDFPSLEDLVRQLQETAPKQHARLGQVLKEFQVFLVVNMVKTQVDPKSAEVLQSVCSDFLKVPAEILGQIEFDPALEAAVNQMLPFSLQQKKNRAGMDLQDIATRVLKISRMPLSFWEPEQEKPILGWATEAAPESQLSYISTS